MRAVKTFLLSINTNEQCIFVPSKNTAELRNHEINQFTSKKTFEIFQTRKRLAENFVLFCSTWLGPSGFCVQNIVSLLSTFAGSNFCHFCGILSDPQKSSANKIIKRSQNLTRKNELHGQYIVSQTSLFAINFSSIKPLI